MRRFGNNAVRPRNLLFWGCFGGAAGVALATGNLSALFWLGMRAFS